MQKKPTDFRISEEEVANFFRDGKPKTASTNETIFQENQTCNSIIYLKKGITRHFINTIDGKEITKNFTIEGNFVFYSISSFLTKNPSKIQFQAITDCEFIEWNRRLFDQYFSDERWFGFYHDLIKNFAIKKEEKEISLLTELALTRYENFVRNKGKLLNLVPQYYIASYLGMSPETLSRVRRSIS